MTEVKSPVCTACGVEWFHHGGMPHDFEHPTESPPPTLTEIYAAQELAADAAPSDFSRDYTEEIEAHRLTRERAEKAERQLAEEREWFACSQRGLAEANARLAELTRREREVEAIVSTYDEGGEPSKPCRWCEEPEGSEGHRTERHHKFEPEGGEHG